MAKPKLSSKTPDDVAYNTLIETHGDLLAFPRERRYAIVELATMKLDTEVATGEQQATVQIIHLEQPSSSADEQTLTKLLDGWYKKRRKQERGNPRGDEDTPLEGLATVGGTGGDDDEADPQA